MDLQLWRHPNSDGCTLGDLYVNGKFLCFSLEPDEDRPQHPAIPVGRYKVVIVPSVRFKRMVPLIVNVPGRQFIEIHPGNTAAPSPGRPFGDTEGCILLGTALAGNEIRNSRAACELFQSAIAKPLANGEEVWLTISDGPRPVKA